MTINLIVCIIAKSAFIIRHFQPCLMFASWSGANLGTLMFLYFMFNFLILTLSTVVEHSPHHSKVYGLSLTAWMEPRVKMTGERLI